MQKLESTVFRIAATKKIADEWALVLSSQGLRPQIVRSTHGFEILVAADEHDHASATLAAYEHENRVRIVAKESFPAPDFASAGVVFLTLLVFFTVTGPRDFDVTWFERGSADAERILAGETWRTVTALTLHADLGHAIGNAAAGTLFVGALFGWLGVGLGGALVLAAGALGNLANAYFRATAYSSVGASTAVFGALGILAAVGVVRHWRRGRRGRRALAPIAAGLGLLAMLGTGARSDLSGHLFGLAIGVLLGLPPARMLVRAPGKPVQIALAGAVLAILLSCWATALQGSAALRGF